MTREEKLQAIRKLRNPDVTHHLKGTDGLEKILEKVTALKGDKGDPGYTPIKGKDYYTVAEIDAIVKFIQSRVKEGEKGDVGQVGPPGKDGETPVRLVDYWTPEDQAKIISDVLSNIKVPQNGKDGISPNIDDVVSKSVEELKKIPFDIKKVLGDPQLRMLLRGGGATFLSQLHDVAIGSQTDKQTLSWDAASSKWVPKTVADVDSGSITFIIDGGGATITAGIKGDLEIPFDCTINYVVLLSDQTGSIVVDIWKDIYANYPPTVADSITAAVKPKITADVKSKDTTLIGWTTSIVAGDTLRFNVDSVATVQRLTLSLKITKV